MKRVGTWSLAFWGIVTVFIFVGLTKLDRLTSVSVDLSRRSLTHLKPETIDYLSHLKNNVHIDYYVSDRGRMPSSLRRLPRDVQSLLEELRRHSNGHLSYRLTDPTDDPKLAEKIGFKKISPFSQKTIRQDEISVNRIWSGIVLTMGPKDRSIPTIVQEHLGGLERKIVREIQELEFPKPIIIGLSMPWPDRGLRQMMASGSKVLDFNFDKDPIPAEAELAFIIQPHLTTARAQALREFLANGKSIFVFASPTRLKYRGPRDNLEVSILPEELNLREFFDELGVEVPQELVLDENHLGGNPSSPIVPPFGSDMSRFKSKMVGQVVVPVASPILLNPARMKAAGWTSEVLIHSTILAWTRKAPSIDIPWESFVRPPQGPWERHGVNFGVLLVSDKPWQGKIFLFSSQFLFDDAALQLVPANINYLHNALQSFTTEDYRPEIPISLEKPPILPPLDSSQRLKWRWICVGVLPLLLFVAMTLKMREGRRPMDPEPMTARDDGHVRWLSPRRRPGSTVMTLLPIVIISVIAIWPRRLSPDIDMTGGHIHRLDPLSINIYKKLASDVDIRYFTTPPQDLSPVGKRLVATIRDRLRRIERSAFGHIKVQEVTITDEQARNSDVVHALEKINVSPFSLETIEEDAYKQKRIFSSLTLESNGHRETIGPIIPGTEMRVEFLVDAALLRLLGANRPGVTLIAEQPRLTPAEALSDYAQWSQPVPQSPDVYSHVRELLRLYGYRVQTLSMKDLPMPGMHLPFDIKPSTTPALDPSQNPDIEAALTKFGFGAKSVSPEPEQTIESDLLVYLQPFTMNDRFKSEIDRHLDRGGSVFVAVQHFNIQERTYRTRGFKPVYWPQPQFTRVNEWIEHYGLSLVHEVLLDRNQKQATLETQIRWGVNKEGRRDPVALPFMIHAAPDAFDRQSTITGHLSDQLFIAGNRFSIDERKLGALKAKPLITTIAKAWSIDWKGGFLSQEDLMHGQVFQAPQPLVLEVTGYFPSILEASHRARAAGRLILVGCSDMFKDDHLLDPNYRSSDLLMNAVVDTTYGSDLAHVHAKSIQGPMGFGYLSPTRKMLLRLFIVLLYSFALVCYGFLRWVLAQRSPA